MFIHFPIAIDMRILIKEEKFVGSGRQSSTLLEYSRTDEKIHVADGIFKFLETSMFVPEPSTFKL